MSQSIQSRMLGRKLRLLRSIHQHIEYANGNVMNTVQSIRLSILNRLTDRVEKYNELNDGPALQLKTDMFNQIYLS